MGFRLTAIKDDEGHADKAIALSIVLPSGALLGPRVRISRQRQRGNFSCMRYEGLTAFETFKEVPKSVFCKSWRKTRTKSFRPTHETQRRIDRQSQRKRRNEK